MFGGLKLPPETNRHGIFLILFQNNKLQSNSWCFCINASTASNFGWDPTNNDHTICIWMKPLLEFEDQPFKFWRGKTTKVTRTVGIMLKGERNGQSCPKFNVWKIAWKASNELLCFKTETHTPLYYLLWGHNTFHSASPYPITIKTIT